MIDANEIKYKSAFNETVDAIIISDGTSGKIVDVNKACCNLFGYKEHELIGQHLSNLFSGKSHLDSANSAQTINMFDGVLSNRVLKTKSGEFIPVDMTLNTFEGRTSNYVMTTLRDAREKLRYENEIIAKNKELNEINASKDKLFSIIAHDLKNPLSALMGLSEMMIEDCEDIPHEQVIEMFNSINRLSKDTYDLLDNLLNWSRVQTKRITMEIEPLRLYDVVWKMISILKPSAELKKITLINNVPQSIIFDADENMIKTVIRNLLSNSIKFSNADTKITVEAQEDQKEYVILVTDEGVGMEEDYISNLFNPGIQTSRYGTNNEKGTGFGLLLCNEFVKLHKGNIKVTSRIGVGTKFRISLPK